MLEGHRLAEQLAVEERARALRELRREFEGEQANREEVLGQVRRAEDLWGQVLTEEGVQRVVGALTQTVSSEENSIPMDRSGKKCCTISRVQSLLISVFSRQEAKQLKVLLDKLVEMDSDRDHLRATLDWMRAQDWDRLGAEVRAVENKLLRKEAELFAEGEKRLGEQ